MSKTVKRKRVKKIIYKRKKSKSRRKRNFIFILSFVIFLSATAAWFYYKKKVSAKQHFVNTKYIVKGIDVSHHNPILNWESVAEQGIHFAYMKATEGVTHIDRNYIYNYERASKTSVRIGSYHFYTFALSGKKQASHFIKNAKFGKGNMIPAIDVEHSEANLFSKDDKYVGLVVAELKALENELYEYFGVHPILYTNKDCYKIYIKGNFPNNWIWICDLENEPDEKIPWRIWQFSHKGRIDGLSEEIDLNYYKSGFENFKELVLP